jgi:hypothetical protein
MHKPGTQVWSWQLRSDVITPKIQSGLAAMLDP